MRHPVSANSHASTSTPSPRRFLRPHPLDPYREHVLGAFRAVVGLLFACHGAATLFDVLGGPSSGAVPALGQWPSWWAAVIQLLGGVLVLVGVTARTAALVCSGSMAYAYFVSHQPDGLFPLQNGGVPAALYCWAFLLIAVLGPGSWAGGVLLRRRPRGDGR